MIDFANCALDVSRAITQFANPRCTHAGRADVRELSRDLQDAILEDKSYQVKAFLALAVACVSQKQLPLTFVAGDFASSRRRAWNEGIGIKLLGNSMDLRLVHGVFLLTFS